MYSCDANEWGCKPKRDDHEPSVSSKLLDGYVAEAKRLIETLNAFDGSGIPRSDAYDAFSLLRKIAKREAV